MEAILPYLSISMSSEYIPETTAANTEPVTPTEPETDAVGNTIPASANPSDDERVQDGGILNDPTESAAASSEESSSEEGGNGDGPQTPEDDGSQSQEDHTTEEE